MHLPTNSRRQFLKAGSTIASSAWLASNWPMIAAAAEHAAHSDGTEAGPRTFDVLTADEAADIDAIANQIVPGGSSPGARDARVVYFIDRALGRFFADQLPALREGLHEFQRSYAAHSSSDKPFAAASDARQIDWLNAVDDSPFFETVRRLTLIGLIALPKYGGNFNKAGWALLGFDDRHFWQPPFGHYDESYQGFEPYPGTRPYAADEKAGA